MFTRNGEKSVDSRKIITKISLILRDSQQSVDVSNEPAIQVRRVSCAVSK